MPDDIEGLFYTVIHDLKSPLRSIDAACQALREIGGEGDEELERIERASSRIRAMVTGVLAYARAGEWHHRPEPIHIVPVVTEAALELGIPDGVLEIHGEPILSADPEGFRTVIGNLLDNAWKFCQGSPQPQIIVSARSHGNGISISIRDNGVGFDPAQINRLFTPFERLHSAVDFPGTGLGLASVRRIVERHGGSVSVTGKPGKGAEVVLNFPGHGSKIAQTMAIMDEHRTEQT